jgi:hypothetical protein
MCDDVVVDPICEPSLGQISSNGKLPRASLGQSPASRARRERPPGRSEAKLIGTGLAECRGSWTPRRLISFSTNYV